MSANPSQRRAELLLLSVTVIWGSTFVITKSFIDENSPLLYTSIRFFLSAILTYVVFFRRCNGTTRDAARRGIILGVLLFVGFALQTVGIQTTTASKSAFFTGMLVVFTPIIHFLAQRRFNLRRKDLRVGNIVAVVMAAFGLYLLTSPEGSEFTMGDGLTLGCALAFAVYIVYLDTVPEETDKMQVTYVMFLVCAALGLLSAGMFEQMRVSVSPGFVVAVLYLTIFATVIAMGVQNRYQGDTTPTRAALIFSLEPVIAAVFGYVVRGEQLGPVGIAGGMIMVGGVLLSEFAELLPVMKRRVGTS